MHVCDVHKTFYLNCEMHCPWGRGSDVLGFFFVGGGGDEFGHLVNMYF